MHASVSLSYISLIMVTCEKSALIIRFFFFSQLKEKPHCWNWTPFLEQTVPWVSMNVLLLSLFKKGISFIFFHSSVVFWHFRLCFFIFWFVWMFVCRCLAGIFDPHVFFFLPVMAFCIIDFVSLSFALSCFFYVCVWQVYYGLNTGDFMKNVPKATCALKDR